MRIKYHAGLMVFGFMIWAESGMCRGQSQVVSLRREPAQLLDAGRFQVNLSLQPQRVQIISAPANGFVLNVQVAPGESVAAQRDCVRLDDARQKEVVHRAQANLEGARIELKIAGEKGDKNSEALAKAHVEVAEAELNLSKLDLDVLICRSPFQGLVLKQHVFPGQFVRMGEPLITLADVTQLRAEVPIDRNVTRVGQEIEILTDQNSLKGKVTTLLPPSEEIKSLQQIIPGLATAVVMVNGQGGDFLPGQTIYSPVVPQEAVCLVPANLVLSHTEGRRKVQVIRNNIVRDIVVEALAQKGTDRVYVSGAFAAGDELLTVTSVPLKDGQRISAVDGSVTAPMKEAPPAGTAPPPAKSTGI